MPEISVIMPARDVAGYVDLLLGDLRSQSFEDFEVLMVDDASVDGTLRLLERAVERDRRFRLLRGDGSGQSVANNRALQHADSDAVAFVDADDRISRAYLATMRASMRATGSDLVTANVRRLHGGRTRASRLHRRAFTRPRAATHLRDDPQLVFDTTVWNKLSRRSLWDSDGLRFSPGRWINDVYPNLRLHVLARQVDVLDDVLYHWRVREDPLTSVTSRKFHDPEARFKSLVDRIHAIEQCRRMLAEDLPDATVRARFDERLLTHDLWTYLPMYTEADRRFRVTLTAAVTELFANDPAPITQQSLGPLLSRVYLAMLAGDRRQVADLLSADTEVVARGDGDALTTWVEPPPRRGRRGMVERRGTSPAVGGQPRSLSFEGRIEQVRLTAEPSVLTRPSVPDPKLTVVGRLRLRDGQSDLVGRWQVRVTLQGQDATVVGEPVILDAIGDQLLHPLRRSGWRSFRAVVDLSGLREHPTVTTWRTTVEVMLGGVISQVPVTPSGRVATSLVVGVPLDENNDVRAELDAKHRVVLRRRRAVARLLAAHREGDTMVLEVIAGATEADGPDMANVAPLPAVPTIRLSTSEAAPIATDTAPDGSVAPRTDDQSRPGSRTAPTTVAEHGSTVDIDGRVRLPLPSLPASPGRNWQLWVERPSSTPQRLRPTPGLTTTRLAADDDTELVLRPTVKGGVNLTVRTPRISLDSLRTGDAPALIELHGPSLHPKLMGLTYLVLTDVWGGAKVRVPLYAGASGWHATLPLPRLADGSTSPATANQWRLQAANRDGRTVRLHVEVEVRSRFPMTSTTSVAAAELRMNADGRLRLMVGRTERPPTVGSG